MPDDKLSAADAVIGKDDRILPNPRNEAIIPEKLAAARKSIAAARDILRSMGRLRGGGEMK